MRLRDIQHILQVELPKLVIEPSELESTTIGNARTFARRHLEAGLRGLMKVEAFRDVAYSALNHPALSEIGEPTKVLDVVLKDFQNNVLYPLTRRAQDLLVTIDSILPDENPLSFAFRLPDGEWDLKSLEREIDDLKLIFDEPLARAGLERSRVEALDRGSLIVELVVGTPAAVFVVSQLCKAARTLMDTRNQYRVQELQYESLQLDVKLKASLVEANQAVLAQITRKVSEGVAAAIGKPGDNELVNLLGTSLDKLSQQFDKGAAVSLALNAPPEAKKLMPKPGDPPLLADAVIKELLASNPLSVDGEGEAEGNAGEGEASE